MCSLSKTSRSSRAGKQLADTAGVESAPLFAHMFPAFVSVFHKEGSVGSAAAFSCTDSGGFLEFAANVLSCRPRHAHFHLHRFSLDCDSLRHGESVPNPQR